MVCAGICFVAISCTITKALKLQKTTQFGEVHPFSGKKTFYFNDAKNHKYIVLEGNLDTLSMNLILDYGAPSLLSDQLKEAIPEPLNELTTQGTLPNGEKKTLTLHHFVSNKFNLNDIRLMN